MTVDTAPDSVLAEHRLGWGMVERLRRPGPGRLRSQSSRIGSVASSSVRFATSLSRPVVLRRQLRGPAAARVHSFQDAGMGLPRWWHPALMPERDELVPHPVSALPPRGLPRAAHRVPTEQNWVPGGILGSLVSIAAPVRRLDAVAGAGPMLTSHDRAKLSATKAMARAAESAPAGAPRGAVGPSGAPTPRPAKGGSPKGAPTPGPELSAPGRATARSSTDNFSAAPTDGPSGRTAPSGTGPSGTALSGTSAYGVPRPAPRMSDVLSRPGWLPERITRFDAVRRTAHDGPAVTRSTMQVSAPEQPGVLPPDVAPPGGGNAAPGLHAVTTAVLPSGFGPAPFGRVGAGAPPNPMHSAVPLRRMVHGARVVRPALRVADATPQVLGLGVTSDDPRAVGGPGRHSARHQATDRYTAARPSTRAADRPQREGPSGVATSPEPGSAVVLPSIVAGQQHAPGRRAGADSPAATAGMSAPIPLRRVDAREMPAERRAPQLGVEMAMTRRLAAAVRPDVALRPALAAAALPTASTYRAWSRTHPAPDAAVTRQAGEADRTAAVRRSPSQPPAPKAGSVAQLSMSDLLATGVAAPWGSAGNQPWALASAFSADQPIRPVGSTMVPAPTTPTGLDAHISHSAVGRFTAAMPFDFPTSPPGSAGRHPSRAAGAPARRGKPTGTRGTSERSGGAAASASASATVAVHALLPSPPPISIRRTPAAAPQGPAIPASAKPGSGPLVRGPEGTLRRSLVETTAALFAAAANNPSNPSDPAEDGNDADDRALQRRQVGQLMALDSTPRLRAVGPDDTASISLRQPADETSVLDDPRRLAELVDAVVERIEARVIDELERRGRRQNPGVF